MVRKPATGAGLCVLVLAILEVGGVKDASPLKIAASLLFWMFVV